MNIVNLKILISFSALSLIISCAHIGSKSVDLEISDIEGTWESIHFAYLYLDIRDDNDGYLVVLAEENDNDIYGISSTSFSGGTFTMTLKKLNEGSDEITVEGNLFGKNILIIKSIDEDEKDEDLTLFFKREGKVPELREKAKQLIKEKE